LQIEVSDQNYERLVEIREKTGAESIDEVIDWLLDFWFSWSERARDISE